VVVESPRKSGTLITAGQSLEFGRSVMVVPGRVDAPGFEGSHRLIRDGATLVTSVDEVVEELENLFNRRVGKEPPAEPRESRVSLSPDEQKIMDALAASDGGCPVDVIAGACGIPAHKIMALLVGLEMKRVARVLPGGLVTGNTGA